MADIPQMVKQAVHSVVPTADVILFGSRARGDAQPDSDWDFLVLTDEPFSWGLKSKIHDAVYDEVIYETNETIFCIVRTKADWTKDAEAFDPFRQNVLSDGLAV